MEGSTGDSTTTVMLVDDHSMVRDLLRDYLESSGEFRVVAEAGDGAEALRLLDQVSPDVVVMDVIMPGMDGVEACRLLLERLPGTRVLMLTASNERDGVMRSIAAGATGYLQKYARKQQLLATLREVADGEFRIPGEDARRLAQAVRSLAPETGTDQLSLLTQREREIVALYAKGMSYQAVGDARGISGLTVRNAVASAQKKLGFTTRQQMVLWAVRIGLVEE